MRTDAISFPAGPQGNANGPSPSVEPWLLDFAELARLTTLSERHLRRLDADRCIPGRMTCGRRVLFLAEAVRKWLRDGMPSAQ